MGFTMWLRFRRIHEPSVEEMGDHTLFYSDGETCCLSAPTISLFSAIFLTYVSRLASSVMADKRRNPGECLPTLLKWLARRRACREAERTEEEIPIVLVLRLLTGVSKADEQCDILIGELVFLFRAEKTARYCAAVESWTRLLGPP